MRSLLDLLVVMALVGLLVGCVSVALLLRRAVRRLLRAVRSVVGVTRRKGAPRVSPPLSDGQAGAWNLSHLRAPAGLVTSGVWGSALSARAYLPGAAGAVSRIRRDLQRELIATSRTLRAARRAGRPAGGLDASHAALVRQARELQLDLRIVAAEPDRRLRARLLSAHASRATLIQRTCAQIRAAVLEEGSGSHAPALQRIVEEVNDAVTTMSLRARAYRELSHL